MILGAVAGAIGVALFVAGSLVLPERTSFDAANVEIAAWYGEDRTRIHAGVALLVLAGPFLVCFLATVASIARAAGDAARRAGLVAFGCGLAFLTLFLADVTTIAVGALRPDNMRDAPEVAVALQDYEFLLMGSAAPLVAAMFVAFAVLALRYGAVWPAWLGALAVVAAGAYAVRLGALFTTDGPFAANGVLGLYVPVVAVAAWLLAASVVLTLDVRAGPRPDSAARDAAM